MKTGTEGLKPARDRRLVALVQAFQGGDREAYDRIYSLAFPTVYYFVYKMIRDEHEAQDVTQEIFVTIYQKLPDLAEPKTFKSWMNRIAVNCCRDYLQSTQGDGRYEPFDPLTEDEAAKALFSDSGEQIQALERRFGIMEAIDRMSPTLRTVVLLRFVNGLKEREIAEAMQIPLSTAKHYIVNAKKELSGRLAGMYSFAPFFFVRLALSREQAAVTAVSGVRRAPKPYFRAASAAAGITAATAAAVLLQGPVIREVKYYGQESYVNEQTLEFRVESTLPLSFVGIEGEPWTAERDGELYRIRIPKNGTYVLSVSDTGGQTDRKTVTIGNIDREAPVFQGHETRGELVLLRFEDRLSGIDWENASFLDETGKPVVPWALDRQRGEVLFSRERFPAEARVEDMAGNYGSYALTLRQMRLPGNADFPAQNQGTEEPHGDGS